MFPTHKRIVLLHLGGNVIRTTADHPFFVQGQGWTEAADLRPGDPLLSHDGRTLPVEGVTDSGEQEVVYQLNPGVHPMPDQPPPNAIRWPIIGFVAGTPVLTPNGPVPIEELRPGDFIQSRPEGEQSHDDQADDEHDEAEPPHWWEGN